MHLDRPLTEQERNWLVRGLESLEPGECADPSLYLAQK